MKKYGCSIHNRIRKPSLSVRFKNAISRAGEFAIDIVEIFPGGEELINFIERREILDLTESDINTYRKVRLFAPKGIKRDEWAALVREKARDPQNIGSLSEAHFSLSIRLVELLGEGHTKRQALSLLASEDVLSNPLPPIFINQYRHTPKIN